MNQKFTACEKAIDDNDARITALEGTASPNIVRGHVALDGSVVTGSGFAATYSASANDVYYTVRYDYTYTARPVVLITPLRTGFRTTTISAFSYTLSPHPPYGWAGGFVLHPWPLAPVSSSYQGEFAFAAMVP